MYAVKEAGVELTEDYREDEEDGAEGVDSMSELVVAADVGPDDNPAVERQSVLESDETADVTAGTTVDEDMIDIAGSWDGHSEP